MPDDFFTAEDQLVARSLELLREQAERWERTGLPAFMLTSAMMTIVAERLVEGFDRDGAIELLAGLIEEIRLGAYDWSN